MLLYNNREAISVGFRKYKSDYIEYHDDISLDVLEHFSHTKDVEELEFTFLGDGQHITECDYCGEQLFRDWLPKEENGDGGKAYQEYKNGKKEEYPFTDDACRNCVGKKNRITHFINHGTIKNVKAMETRAKNGHVPTSRQQIFLSNLLNGQLNPYFKDIGYIDIVIEDSKLVVEYDGSGHYLGNQFGQYTMDEKIKQDYERDLKLRKMGYKVIRIHSEYDYLPSDEVIVKEINNILDYFEKTGKEFFKWIIPKSKKDKRYGTLREIKEEDLGR